MAKDAKKSKGGRKKQITARITHLEMTAAPTRHVLRPSRPRLALMRVERIPLAFYRYLYEQIGRQHHWFERRRLDDDALAAIVHAEHTQIDVLYGDGAPAGMAELDLSNLPDTVALAYFGLTPEFQGMGLGRWFLAQAIDAAWAHHPAKVTVHTNTLDHPAALSLYQKLGFEPVAFDEETVEVWE